VVRDRDALVERVTGWLETHAPAGDPCS
jgi:hypothetical protein